MVVDTGRNVLGSAHSVMKISLLALGALATLALCPAAEAALSIQDPGQGSVRVKTNRTAVAELSGLTWVKDSLYYAVGDDGTPAIWMLSIALDPRGRIRSSSVLGSLSVPGLGSDVEGIAYRATTDSVFVSDEETSTIREYDIESGKRRSVANVPAIYRQIRPNFGLESLSMADGRLWTANEEALKVDGPRSTPGGGTVVRIQRFNKQGQPDGQWAYLTDPIRPGNLLTLPVRSGVGDLLALPGGGLLVLERELGGMIPEFRTRIYEVSFTGATDISKLKALNNARYTPVKKRLLWEHRFAATNYEGITLGPKLANGGRSLLLVSDDGSGRNGMKQDLYPLVLMGLGSR